MVRPHTPKIFKQYGLHVEFYVSRARARSERWLQHPSTRSGTHQTHLECWPNIGKSTSNAFCEQPCLSEGCGSVVFLVPYKLHADSRCWGVRMTHHEKRSSYPFLLVLQSNSILRFPLFATLPHCLLALPRLLPFALATITETYDQHNHGVDANLDRTP